MDNQDDNKYENEVRDDIKGSIEDLTEAEWESASWPVLAVVSRQIYSRYERNREQQDTFWKQALDPANFLTPDNTETLLDPERDFVFVIHSFKDSKGRDCIFKAITTEPKNLVEHDASHAIDFRYHGGPCEARGGGSYPTVEFWPFYDNSLSEQEQGKYLIPDTNWRESFVKKQILKK